MRKLYVVEKQDQPRNKIRDVTKPENPIEMFSIQTLIRYGLLRDSEGTMPPWPTDLLKQLLEILYNKNELKNI